jgi:hypothetical protein
LPQTTSSTNLSFVPSTGTLTATNLAYTGTLTGGTGVVNLGSGQFYKDASGNVGIGATPAAWGLLKPIQINNAAFAGYSGRPYMIANSYYTGSQFTYQTNDYAGFYAIQNGQHTWYNAVSGTAGAAATMNNQMTLNNNGALVLYNGNTSATGVGIAFPVNQSASSDAHTLDDYEKGTWTPANSQGVSMTKNSASYTKIGRMVTVTFDLTVSANSNTNNFSINNLPFTPSFNSAGSLGYCEATTGSRITSDTGAFSIYTSGNAILTCITLSGLRFWGSLTYPAST